MFVNKLFTYFTANISKSKRCFNVISTTYYFHIKTKTFADFQICISVPLSCRWRVFRERVEKGCIGNKWFKGRKRSLKKVKNRMPNFLDKKICDVPLLHFPVLRVQCLLYFN